MKKQIESNIMLKVLAFLLWTGSTLVAHSTAKQWLSIHNSLTGILWLTTAQVTTGFVVGWLYCYAIQGKRLALVDSQEALPFGIDTQKN